MCDVWHCDPVVKVLLARAEEPGSTPGDALCCFFFLLFFFSCSLCFLILLFWPVFLYS